MYLAVPKMSPACVAIAAIGPVEAGDAEVEHLHVVGVVAAAHEHHVLGLEIAVDDALRVRLADRVADLERDVERARAAGAPAPSPLVPAAASAESSEMPSRCSITR